MVHDSDSSHGEFREDGVRRVWDSLFEDDDHFLLGSRKSAVNLSTLHPDPSEIPRLWQVYLENVSPLLKVVHTPSLQARIIAAAGNTINISPNQEALMFSIYCMAVLSLDKESCEALFGTPKEDLVTRYQFGCQQALLNAGFLRTDDRDCLTSLLHYLVSLTEHSLLLFARAHRRRYRLDPLRILDLCRQCSAWRFESHDACPFTAKQPVPNTVPSRPRCAEDSGGRSCSLTVASARWPTTRRLR